MQILCISVPLVRRGLAQSRIYKHAGLFFWPCVSCLGCPFLFEWLAYSLCLSLLPLPPFSGVRLARMASVLSLSIIWNAVSARQLWTGRMYVTANKHCLRPDVILICMCFRLLRPLCSHTISTLIPVNTTMGNFGLMR